MARATAVPALRAAVVAVAVALGRGEWRFGVSLSLTGHLLPHPDRGVLRGQDCDHCQRAVNALELWRDTVNSRGLLGGHEVVLDIRDDSAFIENCLQNYRDMAADSSIHALIGPSYIFWNADVAAIAEEHQKLLVTWAFDTESYRSHPLMWETTSGRNLSRRLEDSTASLAGLSLAPTPSDADREAPSRRATSTRYSFDVNVPEELWTVPAIDDVGVEGKNFLLVYFSDLPGNVESQRQCEDAYKYLKSRNGSAALMPSKGLSQLALNVGVLFVADPDVVVFCGQAHETMLFLQSLRARDVNPFLILTRPTGESPVFKGTSNLRNELVEPWPMSPPMPSRSCPVFQNYSEFVRAYQAATGSVPDYAAHQAAAAGVLLTQALRGMTPGSFTADTVVNSLLGSATETFFGKLRFVAGGTRAPDADGWPSARRFSALEDAPALDRFLNSRMQLISPGALDDCNDARSFALTTIFPELPCSRMFLRSLPYPSKSWAAKTMEVSPCDLGCILHNNHCQACPRGTIRGAFAGHEDTWCRPCDSSTFAERIGSQKCASCPWGANCSNSSATPRPQHGRCRISPWTGSCAGEEHPEVPRTPVSIFDKELLQQTTALINCTPPSEHEVDYTFTSCLPMSVCVGGTTGCVGSNRGLLCGQCKRGMSYQGIGSGRRRCKECPTRFWLFARIFFVCLFYGVMVGTGVRLAGAAISNPNYLPLAMFRSFVHTVHLFSAALEATALDSMFGVAWLLLPFDYLYRPLDLIMMDCMDGNPEWSWVTSGLAAKRMTVAMGRIMIPVGIFWIVLFHAIADPIRISLEAARHGAYKFLVGVGEIVNNIDDINGNANLIKARVEQLKDQTRNTVSNLNIPHLASARSLDASVSSDLFRGPSMFSSSKSKPISDLHGETEEEDKADEDEPAVEIFSQASDEDVDDFERKENFKRTDRASRAYGWRHFARKAHLMVHELYRPCLLWVLFTYPITVRSFLRSYTCVEVGALGSRLRVDLDVECEPNFERVLRLNGVIIVIAVPLFLRITIWLWGSGSEIWTQWFRGALVLLIDGYKPEFFWWESVHFCYIGFLLLSMESSDLLTRCTNMLSITIFYFVLLCVFTPYEPLERNALVKFNLGALAGASLLIITGALAQQEYNATILVTSTNEGGVALTLLISMLTFFWNWYVCLDALASCWTNTISLQLQVTLDDGGVLSPALNWIHRMVYRVRGLNPVVVYVDHTQSNRCFIDASKLTGYERHLLAVDLMDTFSACVDSTNIMQSHLVEKCIREAAVRAEHARKSLLHRQQEEYGTLTRRVTCCPCFQATLRNPDIDLEEDPESDDELERQGTRIQVTIEELQAALRDVNTDVLEHTGGLHKKEQALLEDDDHEGEGHFERHHTQPHMLAWTQTESFKSFFETAAIDEEDGGDDDSDEVQDSDPELFNELEVETRREKERSGKSRASELREFYALEAEVVDLRAQLGNDDN